jgi:hypothetical protein
MKPYRGETIPVAPLPLLTLQTLEAQPQSQPLPTSGVVDDDLDATLRLIGFESLERLLRITKDEVLVPKSTGRQRISIMGIYSPVNGRVSEPVTDTYIPRGPSSSFHKQTWWDSLLSLYSDDPTQSALKVFQDLNFL